MGPMRTREFFLASMLTITFGCPGDDGTEDTGAMTSGNTTTGMTNMSTSSAEDSTTSGGGGTTTSGGEESTSTGGGGGSTTTGSAEEESSSGGNAACQMFCADYITTCGAGGANDYGDEAGCVQSCEMYSQDELDCRVEHLGYAMDDGTPDSVHCGHANRDGGGVC